jgi:hypothetical protein
MGTLPNGTVVDCSVQDHGYDRRMIRNTPIGWKKLLAQVGRRREMTLQAMMRRGLPVYRFSQVLDRIELALGKPADQTLSGALAQIQAIARKLPA